MHYIINTSINNPLKLKQKYYYKVVNRFSGINTFYASHEKDIGNSDVCSNLTTKPQTDNKSENNKIITYSIYNYLHTNDPYYYPYRSVIVAVPENQVLAFSPPKSIPFQQFFKTNPYLHYDIIINEWIEGVMINLFFDQRTQSWEISTKGSINGNYVYKPRTISGLNNPKESSETSIIYSLKPKTYYQMFLEALSENIHKKLNDVVIFKNFPKQYSYSFVLQHPDIHILLNKITPRVYLVSIFEIDSQTTVNNSINHITYISPNIYEKWGLFSNILGVLHFPQRYDLEFDNYTQIIEKMSSLRTQMNTLGIVLTNSITGERTTIRNMTYDKINSSLKMYPVNQYQYLCLYKIKKVDEFLLKYPGYKNAFDIFEEEYNYFITNLHNTYYMVYIKKSLKKKDISQKYLSHIYKLHYEVYLPSLSNGEIKIINKKEIREYFNKFEPHQQLYYLNYERRKHAFNIIE